VFIQFLIYYIELCGIQYIVNYPKTSFRQNEVIEQPLHFRMFVSSREKS